MIKNYTSGVPAARSVSYIEQRLVDYGASNIVKRYDANKHLVAIMFQIPRGNQLFPVVLPARIEAVEKTLRKSLKRPRPGTLEKLQEQAERTAWKILADWVDVQFSMIQLEQAEFLEVFLPYLYDPKSQQSFFEVMRDNGFKALVAHKE